MIKKSIVALMLFAIVVSLAACGQKGPEWVAADEFYCADCYEERTPYWWQNSEYIENNKKSGLLYEEAVKRFKADDETYTDDYGGAYVDANGIHHILVTGNRRPLECDYLIYDKVKFSYNYLLSIMDELSPRMEEYTIREIGIRATCNKVHISLEDESKIPIIINHLRRSFIFRRGALAIYVGPDTIRDH